MDDERRVDGPLAHRSQARRGITRSRVGLALIAAPLSFRVRLDLPSEVSQFSRFFHHLPILLTAPRTLRPTPPPSCCWRLKLEWCTRRAEASQATYCRDCPPPMRMPRPRAPHRESLSHSRPSSTPNSGPHFACRRTVSAPARQAHRGR